jgi:hypothetical protein
MNGGNVTVVETKLEMVIPRPHETLRLICVVEVPDWS